MAAAASQGITTPVLYNPYLASGSRYVSLADSQIQRLYHSNAFLLTSGEAMLSTESVFVLHSALLPVAL